VNEYRLLILSLALWLGAAITGLGSHWNVVVLILIALALLINYRGAALILIAALLVGSLGLVIREVTLRNNLISLASLSKTQIQLLATVQSDPILGSGKVVGSHLMRGSYSFKVRSEVVTIGKAVTHIRLPVRVSSRIKIAVIPGDRIDCEGRVLATRERKVAALFVANQACTIIHSASRLEVLTSIIRRTFRTDCLAIAGDVGALIPGMVLGDTSLQTSKFSSQMRRTGLTHLTAVSGENFAIIAAFLLWISQWFFRNIKVRIIVTGIFLIGFIFLVRPSPSVLRACVMTATLLIARLKGERSAALPALGLAISVLILLDPFQATDPGFALSVAATAGILLLSPAINQKL
jgi:competence protein ComEC